MIQKMAEMDATADASAPLKGRVETMETEVARLKQRLSTLQADVVGSSDNEDGGAPQEAVLLDESFADQMHMYMEATPPTSRQNQASLVATKSTAEDLKLKVATLEGDVALLKVKTSELENVVSGHGSVRPSLLEEKSEGSSLEGRIVSLEREIDSLRSRASNLEHTVEG